jgi:hypothetical protein
VEIQKHHFVPDPKGGHALCAVCKGPAKAAVHDIKKIKIHGTAHPDKLG